MVYSSRLLVDRRPWRGDARRKDRRDLCTLFEIVQTVTKFRHVGMEGCHFLFQSGILVPKSSIFIRLSAATQFLRRGFNYNLFQHFDRGAFILFFEGGNSSDCVLTSSSARSSSAVNCSTGRSSEFISSDKVGSLTSKHIALVFLASV